MDENTVKGPDEENAGGVQQRSVAHHVAGWMERNPYFTILGVIATIVGLVTATGFNPFARSPGLAYSVVPSSIDFQRPADSRLAITYDGKPVTDTAVFFERAIIWNKGSEPIRATDVLKPIEVKLDGGELLSVRIAKTSRPEVLATLADPKNTNYRVYDVDVGFNVLEQDDGLNIEVIYSANQRAKITVAGTVVGQKGGPSFVDAFINTGMPNSSYVGWKRYNQTNWVFFGALALGTITGLCIWQFHSRPVTGRDVVAFGIMAFMGYAVLGVVAVIIYDHYTTPLPAEVLSGSELSVGRTSVGE